MPSMILNSFPYTREDTGDNGQLALNVIQPLLIMPCIIASHAMQMHIVGRIILMHNAIIATLQGLPIKIFLSGICYLNFNENIVTFIYLPFLCLL